MRLRTPGHLVIDQLRDLASVQKQLLEARPALIELATHCDLKELLRRHHDQTLPELRNLRKILDGLQVTRSEDCSQAMEGLLSGGEQHLVEVANPRVRDLMMIAHCLRIEGYEIAACEFTAYLAGKCGYHAVAKDVAGMHKCHGTMKAGLQALQDTLFAAADSGEA